LGIGFGFRILGNVTKTLC